MTDEQKAKAAELKAVIVTTAATPTGVPQEVRTVAVALKKEVRRSGTTARVLATALGIHESTLCRWERDAGAGRGPAEPPTRGRGSRSAFRTVRVTPLATTPSQVATAPRTPAATLSRGLRVAHGPSGLVVDGLDVETLAALLRRMS